MIFISLLTLIPRGTNDVVEESERDTSKTLSKVRYNLLK